MQVMTEVFVDSSAESGGAHRWFYSPDSSLFVWYGDDGAIEQFQFCYWSHGVEHALSWSRRDGLQCHRVDNTRGCLARSPVLTAVPSASLDEALDVLRQRGCRIEPAVLDFVATRIH